MELWPGFDTSIREHSDDLLLNCDVVHKVMHTATVYDVLQQTIKAGPGSWRHSFQKRVLGMTVFTGHNNCTYRVDDVDFDISPMTTFRRRDVQVSIDEYYADVSAGHKSLSDSDKWANLNGTFWSIILALQHPDQRQTAAIAHCQSEREWPRR